MNVTDFVYATSYAASNLLHNAMLHNRVVFLEGAQNESTDSTKSWCFFLSLHDNFSKTKWITSSDRCYRGYLNGDKNKILENQ